MITIEHLTKRYGRFAAVDDVSLCVPTGSVTGFLGPNGAGKSTTLRCLVGLCQPDSGSLTVDGRRYAELPNPGAEIGVLLDAGAQHNGRTGREVLRLASIVVGVPKQRVAEMLDLVQLSGKEAGRRVGNYSLGMRQRLGIALALLGGPKTLVLDEPANGLDARGIVWMRDLLRSYVADGGTVLLSSHLLHEVELVAEHIVLIGNGRIVATGTRESLLAAGRSLEQAYLELTAPTA